jgi:hypothetical protein
VDEAILLDLARCEEAVYPDLAGLIDRPQHPSLD